MRQNAITNTASHMYKSLVVLVEVEVIVVVVKEYLKERE